MADDSLRIAHVFLLRYYDVLFDNQNDLPRYFSPWSFSFCAFVFALLLRRGIIHDSLVGEDTILHWTEEGNFENMAKGNTMLERVCSLGVQDAAAEIIWVHFHLLIVRSHSSYAQLRSLRTRTNEILILVEGTLTIATSERPRAFSQALLLQHVRSFSFSPDAMAAPVSLPAACNILYSLYSFLSSTSSPTAAHLISPITRICSFVFFPLLSQFSLP